VLKHSHINWSIVKSIFVGVGSVVAASTLFLLAANWVRSTIDSAVERKLSDPTILRRIAESPARQLYSTPKNLSLPIWAERNSLRP
jgi:hypothetical protein